MHRFLAVYIVVIGLNILIGLSGQLSLGHAGFYALGAYGSGLLANHFQLPFWVTMWGGMILAGIAGALIALIALRAKGPYLAMVTIGFGMLIEIGANRWVSLTNGPAGVFLEKSSVFGKELNIVEYFYFAAVIALICHLFAKNLFQTRFGRTMNAVGNSEIASETIGVYVRNWKVLAFAISAMFAGLGGALFVHAGGYFNSDSFTIDTSIMFLVAVIVGGNKTILGPLVGTAVAVLIPQLFASIYEYHLMIYGGILLVCLLMLPDGVVGTLGETSFVKKIKGWWEKDIRKKPQLKLKEHEDFFKELQSTITHLKSMPNMQVSDLTIDFGGLRAVDQVNFSIPWGTVKGLIGPNGSGKSTVVNMLSGVYSPTSGSISFLGKDVSSYSPHKMAKVGITRTFQNLQIFKDLSVIQNVLMGFHQSYHHSIAQSALSTPMAVREESKFEQQAEQILHFVGLGSRSKEIAENLSYGEQRLLELARALAMKPALLILDEPAAGASPNEVELIFNVIRRLRELGMTILIIEHHMEIVMSICDEIIVLDFGQKIAEGTPKEVENNPRVIEAYLGGEEVMELVRGKRSVS
ncbi:branched-chain amino acid ABC transporter ATP-binding protein/permease [Neobacillus cucumis]|nr:branched-chain amino acid ABC transporter ATP-binding protein/permease [Neobacillus cucumis]